MSSYFDPIKSFDSLLPLEGDPRRENPVKVSAMDHNTDDVFINVRRWFQLEKVVTRALENAKSAYMDRLPCLARELELNAESIVQTVPDLDWHGLKGWLRRSTDPIEDYDGVKLMLPLIRRARIRLSQLRDLFIPSPYAIPDPVLFHRSSWQGTNRSGRGDEHTCITILRTALLESEDYDLID